MIVCYSKKKDGAEEAIIMICDCSLIGNMYL